MSNSAMLTKRLRSSDRHLVLFCQQHQPPVKFREIQSKDRGKSGLCNKCLKKQSSEQVLEQPVKFSENSSQPLLQKRRVKALQKQRQSRVQSQNQMNEKNTLKMAKTENTELGQSQKASVTSLLARVKLSYLLNSKVQSSTDILSTQRYFFRMWYLFCKNSNFKQEIQNLCRFNSGILNTRQVLIEAGIQDLAVYKNRIAKLEEKVEVLKGDKGIMHASVQKTLKDYNFFIESQNLELQRVDQKYTEVTLENQQLRKKLMENQLDSKRFNNFLNKDVENQVNGCLKNLKEVQKQETQKVDLQTLRAREKAETMRVVKDHHEYLCSFFQVYSKLLKNQKSSTFRQIESRGDFCDGFMFKLVKPGELNLSKRFLQQHKLDVCAVVSVRDQEYGFFRFSECHHLIDIQLKSLKTVSDLLSQENELSHIGTQTRVKTKQQVQLKQFDVTRDMVGTFYALEDWRFLWHKLRYQLYLKLGLHLKTNGNSFQTCLQFEESSSEEKITLRLKVYNKLSQLFQSRSALTAMGMRTNGIYYAPFVFQNELREAGKEGLSRMEISYYARSKKAEQEFYSSKFSERAKHDLDKFFECINEVGGLKYTVDMQSFYREFQDCAKESQLLVVHPNSCALVYASNQKRDTYCGFFHDIPKSKKFNIVRFLNKNALPGPNSRVLVVVKNSQKDDTTQSYLYQKDSHISQIPGVKYGYDKIAQLPKLREWTDTSIPDAVADSLDYKWLGERPLHQATSIVYKHQATLQNPQWRDFTEFTKSENISSIKGLRQGPKWVQDMVSDKLWLPKIRPHIKYRSKQFQIGNKPQNEERVAQKRVYADEEEKERMDLCSKPQLDFIETFVKNKVHLAKKTALDVACGSGRLTENLLVKHFKEVDLFDQCPLAIKSTKLLFLKNSRIANVEQSNMQSYSWPKSYDAIFLSYCVGYLDDKDLVKFLQKAHRHLNFGKKQTRGSQKTALIFVIDQYLDPIMEKEYTEKCQRVRYDFHLQDLFKEAGLKVVDKTEPTTLHKDFSPGIIWALN